VRARFGVGKAEEEQPAAGLHEPGERRHVGRPPGVVERVKQAAISDGVEPLRNLADRAGVHLQEVDRHAAGSRLCPGARQRVGKKIDAGDGTAPLRQPDRQIARAATDVQHPTADPVHRRHEGPLGPSDVPRRPRCGVIGREPARGRGGSGAVPHIVRHRRDRGFLAALGANSPATKRRFPAINWSITAAVSGTGASTIGRPKEGSSRRENARCSGAAGRPAPAGRRFALASSAPERE
jgi:hypothetical protein